MFTQLTNLEKALLYYIIAFGLCLGITFMAPLLGSRITEIIMFTPLAAVLLMLLVITRDGYSAAAWRKLGLLQAGLRGWSLALLVPLFALSFAYGIVWISGMATLVSPPGLGSISSFLLDLVVSIAVVSLLGGIGEEIGWRGYLLPRLSGLGVRWAMVLTGLLHGIWHLPVILWTPFYHGAGNRFVIIPLFVLTLTVAGICYGYLRLTTGSVWPAALAHGAFNVLWERFNTVTVAGSPLTVEYLAGESGVLTLLALAATAGWLDYRLIGRLSSGPRQNAFF